MNILLNRTDFTPNSTIGDFSIVDSEFKCFSMEPCDRHLESGGVKIPKLTAIPRGTYKMAWSWSEHFQRMTPHILDVPDFTEIEVHIINFPRDTEGCVGLGKTKAKDFIGESGDMIAAFYPIFENAINTGEEVWIQIT